MKMNIKEILTLVTCIVGITSPALSNPSNNSDALPRVVMGANNAPVKVIMYHSLNCPHCKEFKMHDFPAFKKKYIDTGLVYFEMKDFPIDAISMAAAKLAWCKEKSPESYQKYAQIIMNNFKIDDKSPVEVDWSNVESAHAAAERLTELLGKHGVSAEQCQACLKEATPTENAILKNCLEVQNVHKLDYAPGFLVNGALVEMADLTKAVDKALGPPAVK